MKNIVPLLAALVFCAAASAQTKPLELRSEYADNGDRIIRAEVFIPGTYTVLINFTEVMNYHVSGYEVRPVYASGEVMRIKRENPNAGGSLSYTYTVTPGVAGRDRTDSTFVYTLPYSTHKKDVRYGFTRNVKDRFTNERTRGWISLIFNVQRGDTIFAARKGTVVEVRDEYPSQIIYPNNRTNQVVVQHADNTFAYYYSIEYGGMLVSKGDVVYPGMPLAIVGSVKGGDSYDFYFNIRNLRVDNSGNQARFEVVYYNPVFATAEGTTKLDMNKSYAAVLPEAVVTKEMNAREKKNFLASGYPGTTGSKNVAQVVAEAAAAPPPPARPARTTTTAPAAKPATTAPSPAPRNIRLTPFRGPDGTYAIDAQMTDPVGVYSVAIAFRDVDNYPLPAYFIDTLSASRRLLSVRLTDPGKHGAANFSSTYRWGMATVAADTTHDYRLPFRPENRDLNFGAFRTAGDAKQIRFMMSKGDTIHAVREGLVVAVIESASSPSCLLVVQHADGSDATYSAGIRRDGLSVAPGDRVAEGDPLGTVGSSSGFLSIVLKYTAASETEPGKLEYRYFNPIFRTEKGYARLVPPDDPAR